ncbi:hypothetical protein KV697_08565 [Sphingomonas sanguinis]|uniref:Uncharacterized protein n=1 Tax=Sphingomonas sanguinis TaxID=33051 RepID=A0ABU5LLL7_9SPHN|nr:hypothetical protein [Sphingomonas sanguinis]MDZ7280814.1 hypothetical protein [Sphingomonas sanguinis]QXT37310.1 hypothetical protein KV697_08565 [Sphingomonas sanguinis]
MPLAILTTATAHSGTPKPRTHPEWSDIGLFVFAIGAVWLLRHLMRRRNRKD